MSSIDELKADEPIQINIGTKETPNNGANKSGGKHKVVLPKSTQTSANDRVSVDLTTVAKEEEPDENIHESPITDILEGPDSQFAKYLNKKKAEAEEWMAMKEVEAEIEAEEAVESGEAVTDEDGEKVIYGTDSISSTEGGITEMDIEDIEIDEEDIDSLIDPTEEDVVEETTEESEPEIQEKEIIETVDPVEEKRKVAEATANVQPNKEEKKEVETPDIDLEINDVQADITLIDEEETNANEPVDEEADQLKHLQEMVTERLKPASKSLNISSFTIAKKPTVTVKSLEKTVKAAKWVLPTQESIVLMKEFLGSELEALREASEDSTNAQMLSRKYRLVYDHIASKKPDSYEAWLKATPFSDIDHYFFAIFISSFKGTNYLPVDCRNPKCNESYLTDDINIMKMVKFDTEEAKEKFMNIYKGEPQYTGKAIYTSEVVTLSDKIAIGFKDATIYNLFEIAYLDDAFKRRYSSIIDFIPYIDALYILDAENETLTPIGYKIYPDNVQKSIKSKIAMFNKVLSSLSVDEFGLINSYVRNVANRTTGIRYIFPQTTCPKCGTLSNEIDATAEELVFTRYQLGALVNTSIK